jgi:hypothetical protein
MPDPNTETSIHRFAHLEIDAGPAGSLVAATEMTGKPLAKLLSTIGAGTLTALRAPRPKAKAEARTLESHAQRIGCELR